MVILPNYHAIRIGVTYPMPKDHDDYGFSPSGERWPWSFCVMDDFGNALEHDPFYHGHEDQPFWDAPYMEPTFATCH